MKEISLKKTGIKIGVLLSGSLIIIFFIMKYFGLLQNILFISFYFFVLFFWIFYGINNYRKQVKETIDFFSGVTLGSLITIIGVMLFVMFFYFYCTVVNPEFLRTLNGKIEELGISPDTSILPVAIMCIGLFAGIIFSLLLMYFKTKAKNNFGN